jgi:hypothetical protein
MRAVTAITIAVFASISLAACGGSGSSNGGGGGTTGGAIGETRTIHYAGYGDGMGKEDIAVTLLQIVPSASSSEQGFGPESGDQLVAVQLRVKNLSSAPYSDSTSDCVTATDAADQSIPPQEDSPVTVGPAFPGIVDLTPGGSVTGVLTFEIGSGDSLTAVHFDPSRGDGGSPIATWKVN